MKKPTTGTFLLGICTTLLVASTAAAYPDLDLDTNYLNAPTVREYSFSSDLMNPYISTADYTSLPRKISPLGERAFIFSPKLQRWAAYDKYGYKVAGGIGNGGADFCAETNEPCRTPVGQFRVTRKKGIECESSQFPIGEGGSPMPYCMFFKAGNAIHGSPTISTQNTSHGCIRIYTKAAKWLNRNFLDKGTKVITLPY